MIYADYFSYTCTCGYAEYSVGTVVVEDQPYVCIQCLECGQEYWLPVTPDIDGWDTCRETAQELSDEEQDEVVMYYPAPDHEIVWCNHGDIPDTETEVD